MAFRSRPDREVGAPAAITGPDVRVGAEGGHGHREVRPEGEAHGVAGLGSVEPQGGHGTVSSMVRTSDGKVSREGVLMAAKRRSQAHRGAVPTRPGALSTAGSMRDEARRPGLDPREVLILPTFTPDIAAALPGPAWLTRRRAAAAEAFAGSPLPTEKDEVWRYSRIDQLDLDRFQPAGHVPHRGRSRSVVLRAHPRAGGRARDPGAASS